VKAGRPTVEKVQRVRRWTSVRLPGAIVRALRWCAREHRHTAQKYVRYAVEDLCTEIESGKLTMGFPRNPWYASETEIYGVEVHDALIARVEAAAGQLCHTVSSFYFLAIMRAVTRQLDPENRGLRLKSTL